MLKAFEVILLVTLVVSVFGMFGDINDKTYKHHIACGISGVLFLFAEVARHFLG